MKSRSKFFYYGANNGERSWLGLEIIHVTPKLRIFTGLCPKKPSFIFTNLYYAVSFGKKSVV
jgi:hypothetical protein